jgi:Bacterial tandem repeat domain 1
MHHRVNRFILVKKLWLAVSIGILAVAVSNSLAWGQSHALLQYNGGRVLRTFRIYPLYYGNWSASDITAQQNYLVGLAGYLSGNGKPDGQQPMLWQFGVNEASVAPAVIASPNARPIRLTRSNLLNIVQVNQASGVLPAFGPATLIMVFPAQGFGLDVCAGCGYHSSESSSSFWSVVPHDAGPSLALVTAHEVFESSIDPAIDNDRGWDEAVDGCNSVVDLPFGQIPGAADNTQNGTCSTTGYTSTDEIQVYGWNYTDYRRKYDELWPQGWRLYILQSYVTNGEVLYNAVWRRSISDEIQVYGWAYADYRNKYDELWPQGWRLYILQSYVLNGQVLYNAVWRRGSLGERQTYDTTYSDYRNQYDILWPQNWRLQTLQSYVVNGQVAYNAVWRPGDSGELQVYGWNYRDYRNRYDELWPQGWRLHILQAYFSNGQTLYNAVWRPGSMLEIQVYGYNYADYRSKYDELWPQGWRLYVLDSFVTADGQVLYNAVWRIGTTDRPL